MLRWGKGQTSRIIAGVAVALAGCTSNPPDTRPSATVRTLPAETTIAEVAAPADTIIVKTTIVETTSTSTTTTVSLAPTLPAKPGAPATIYSTPLVLQAPGLDTYPVVTGEYTDQDFARIAVGRYREYWTQAEQLKPDLNRLLVWESKVGAERSFEGLTGAVQAGRHFRRGSIDDFVVVLVDRAEPNVVLVDICGRNNTAEWLLGDRGSDADDKLRQENLEIFRAQWALVISGGQWKVDNILELDNSTCVALLP